MNLNMAGGAQGMMKEGSTLADGVDEAVLKNIGVPVCVKINQCVGDGDDAAALVPSSGEEPASPRHRAGVASMAWRSTRRFSTNAPYNFDFHTGHETARKNSTVELRPERHEEAHHQPLGQDPCVV